LGAVARVCCAARRAHPGRKGTRGMKHYLSIPSPFGAMLLRAEEDALTGLYFVGQKYFPPDGPHVPDAASTASVAPPRVLAESAEQLAEYFAGERQRFAVPLQMAGSAARME
jgi:methylated-DNA-[protein]-cysteine S-methyltransferase